MNKNRINFWIDFLMFIDIVFISLIALILHFVLPPGTGGRHRADPLTFLWLGRHDWGEIHWILGLLFLIILTIHIWLHWKWIVTQIRCTFTNKSTEETNSCETEK